MLPISLGAHDDGKIAFRAKGEFSSSRKQVEREIRLEAEKEGRKESRKEGRKEGRKAGRKEGRKEGNIERARSDRLLSRNEYGKPVLGFGITGVGNIDRRETGK
ncbi:hypothetical protein ALC57_02261 [Trachymyrmex cornetzi]|uniref:Uncharacterized protein n=1 Tax=Trachymyrmex cornetzi TaxID=471704 RepID=A0A195EJ63_9HYME|nr:hypothetical protein ALC57_02261 [Trachymyrmex cornetzi]